MNERVPGPRQQASLLLRPTGKSWVEIVWWGAIVLATTGIAFGYVYYTIFSRFQAYDDEGFILISLKSFFHGKPLYDEVYSSFQPGFFVLHWLVFKVWGAPLCHDSIRLLTLVFWLAAAALNGLITYRLACSAPLALLVSVVSVRCLEPFANEPGHPQALAYVLVAGVVVLFAFADSIRPRLFALAIGSLVGLILLIKINVGLFVLLPVGLMFVSGRQGKTGFWLKIAAGVVMMGLPVALWRAQLAARGAPLWTLCLLEFLALLLVGARAVGRRRLGPIVAMAFVICAAALIEMNSTVEALPVFSVGILSLSICSAVMMCLVDSEVLDFKAGGWAWALCGLGLVVGSITLITILRGTTLHGLADGFFWWPARLSTSFLIRLRSNWLGVCLGLVGAAGCYLYLGTRVCWGNRLWFRATITVGQMSFGLAVLAEFYLRVPGSRALMPLLNDLPHFWMLPFAWLVAVPEPGAHKTLAARLALLAITVMQPLIACPVAGTQLVPASMLIPVVGAVCLGNGLRASFGPATKIADSRAWQLVVGGLAAVMLLAPLGKETLGLRQRYESFTPLNLPGAARIRLTGDEVRVYQDLVAELARPEVETFLTLPGLNSLYLWTQKEPPNSLNVSAWMILLDGEGQERVWRAAQRHPGLRVIRNRRLVRAWVGGRSLAQLPLVRHIEENFTTVSTNGGYELMVRR